MNAAQAWDLVLSGAELEMGSSIRFAANAYGGQQALIAETSLHEREVFRRGFFRLYGQLCVIDEARKTDPSIPVPHCLADVDELLARILQ